MINLRYGAKLPGAVTLRNAAGVGVCGLLFFVRVVLIVNFEIPKNISNTNPLTLTLILIANMFMTFSLITQSFSPTSYLIWILVLSFTVRRLLREELSLVLCVVTELSQATDALCTSNSIFVQIIRQRNQLMARFGPG